MSTDEKLMRKSFIRGMEERVLKARNSHIGVENEGMKIDC
jgi:hypothetical protein